MLARGAQRIKSLTFGVGALVGGVVRYLILLVLPATLLGPLRAADEPKADAKGPKGAFAEVNGAKLWYHAEGKGPPLLIIPGGPGLSHRYLYPHFSALKDTHKVIYFDAFGRGRSDRAKKPEEYTIDRDVQDVEGLRKALKLEKVRLLGFSYGGMVAQTYALKHPKAVDRLMLVVAPHSGEMWADANANINRFLENQYPELWEKMVAWRKKGGVTSDPQYQDLLGKAHPGLFYFFNPKTAEDKEYKEALEEMNLEVYSALCGKDGDVVLGGDIAKFDHRKELHKIAAPTLIAAGRFDQGCPPRWMVKYKEYMPKAKFEMFEKSGHFPQTEEPGRFFAVVRDFLK
jgi:proline iminopeptidase